MNANAKPTLGPWYVENILHGGPRIVYGPANDAGFRDDVPNTQENARLQAAAPELLEALSDLLEYPKNAQVIAYARAAIARATGECHD